MIQAGNFNPTTPMQGTPIKVQSAHGPQLHQLFLCCIFLGAFIGAGCNYMICKNDTQSVGALLQILFCGLSVGGSTGMLISLLFHVIFMGSLEEEAYTE